MCLIKRTLWNTCCSDLSARNKNSVKFADIIIDLPTRSVKEIREEQLKDENVKKIYHISRIRQKK